MAGQFFLAIFRRTKLHLKELIMSTRPMLAKKVSLAVGVGLVLAMISPQIAFADNEGDKPTISVCKKIVFFDKIVFTLKKWHSHEFPAYTELDIKVPDKLTEVANLKEKVKKFAEKRKAYIPLEDIDIKDVSVAAVCVVTKTERKDKYERNEWGTDNE